MMETHAAMEQIDRKPTRGSRWGGMLLVLLGLLLVCLNVLKYRVENWWAIFVALPALLLFAVGQVLPRSDNGRYSAITRFFFASGFIVAVVAGMFLFNLNWGIWWPLMIVTPGVALLYLAGQPDQNKAAAAAWIHTARWLAVSVIGLGALFLAHTFGWVNVAQWNDFHWWGLFIALPAFGAMLNGLRLFGKLGYPGLHVIGLWLVAFFGGITAVIELMGIPWSSFYGVTAVFFIISGFILLLNGLRASNE